jgi:hypothetical protein
MIIHNTLVRHLYGHLHWSTSVAAFTIPDFYGFSNCLKAFLMMKYDEMPNGKMKLSDLQHHETGEIL